MSLHDKSETTSLASVGCAEIAANPSWTKSMKFDEAIKSFLVTMQLLAEELAEVNIGLRLYL